MVPVSFSLVAFVAFVAFVAVLAPAESLAVASSGFWQTLLRTQLQHVPNHCAWLRMQARGGF